MDIHQEVENLVDAADCSIETVTESLSADEFDDIAGFLDDKRNCTVTGLVYNDAGELLFVRHEHEDGWLPPGGMVEPGERIEPACVREIREESGVDAVVEAPQYVRQGIYECGDRSITWYVVKLICRARNPTVGADLGLEDEHIVDAKWFDEIPDSLHELPRRDHLMETFASISQ